MHAATLHRSARLTRLHSLLAKGGEFTTMELVVGAKVMAISAAIAELRQNGAVINCRQEHRPTGRVWLYSMIKPVPKPQVRHG